MTLYQNQGQYDRISDAEQDLSSALIDWKESGGHWREVVDAISALIDVRVEIAKENSGL